MSSILNKSVLDSKDYKDPSSVLYRGMMEDGEKLLDTKNTDIYLNTKGDFYYLGYKIEKIIGDAVINVLREVPMFVDALKKFHDPDINKGYNIILLKGDTKGMQGITTNKFEYYQIDELHEKYKEDGKVYTNFGLSVNLFESNEFLETRKSRRGLIIITINYNLYKVKTKEWYIVKDQAEVVAHEFIIHAMRRILELPDAKNADHNHYFTDTKFEVIYTDNYSPNEQYLLQEAPNAPWAEFYRQLNKVIDEKYPKNNRIKFD